VRRFFSKYGVAVSLGLVFAMALLVRLTGTSFALPTVSFDESHILDRVWIMAENNDLNPHRFNWPSLHFYIDFIILKSLRFFGCMERETFFLACRIFEATVGALTIPVVYDIGRNIFNKYCGLLSAIFLAVYPDHVLYSHIAKVDAVVTFFIMLTFMISIYIVKTGKLRYYVLAAVCAGLATSVKYNGAFAVFLPAIAHFLYCEREELGMYSPKHLAVLIGIPLLAFFITTPYSILDFGAFWYDIAYQSGRTSISLGSLDDFLVLANYAPRYIGWGFVVLALLGLANIAWRLDRYRILLLLFIVSNYIFMFMWGGGSRFFIPIGAGMMIMISGLMMTALEYIGKLRRQVRREEATIALIICLLIPIVFNAITVIEQNSTLLKTSISQVAMDWVRENIPPGATIYRCNNTPSIQYLMDGDEYRYDVNREPDAAREPTWDYDDYSMFAPKGYEYVVLTDYHIWYMEHPDNYPRQSVFYELFLEDYQAVAEFISGDEYEASTIEATTYHNSIHIYQRRGSTATLPLP